MNKNIYPLTFYPIYKNYIWGGNNLRKYGKICKDEQIAESWEISGNNDGKSIINNGIHKDISLNDLILKYKNKILGDNFSNNQFPLLIKLINAKDNLSVQVHPNDEYAQKIENEPFGKTEMWYILETEENSYIYYGLKENTTKKDLEESLKNNTIENYLYKQYVKPGDVIYIPSGTIHCIREGITLLEIQQNSNLTYRLYDYNRIDKNGNKRELHINKALDVINYVNSKQNLEEKEIKILNKNNYEKNIINCPIFSANLLHIENEQILESNKEKFYTYTVINGNGELIYDNSSIKLNKGDSVLIPAYLGKYYLNGKIDIISASPNKY